MRARQFSRTYEAHQYDDLDRVAAQRWCDHYGVEYDDGLGRGPAFCAVDCRKGVYVEVRSGDWILATGKPGESIVLAAAEFAFGYELVV